MCVFLFNGIVIVRKNQIVLFGFLIQRLPVRYKFHFSTHLFSSEFHNIPNVYIQGLTHTTQNRK